MFQGVEKIDSSVFSQKHLAISEIFISKLPWYTSPGLSYKTPQILVTQLSAAGNDQIGNQPLFRHKQGIYYILAREIFRNVYKYPLLTKNKKKLIEYFYRGMALNTHTYTTHTAKTKFEETILIFAIWEMPYSTLFYPSHPSSPHSNKNNACGNLLKLFGI